MKDTEIITIDITKYANALNNLIGIDSAYLNGDKDVDAIVEVIRLAKKMENIIKRQQAEIEMLTAQNGVYETCNARKQEELGRLHIELTAMRGAANSYKLHYGNMKAEIVREFADRLKHTLVTNNEENYEIFDYAYTLETIDSLVKEMAKE